ncbi:MAG: DUF3472 domain-containing protein, partial [Planctomycetes bacterium]|nr:DUF3472 domain-containing protein [Planctomycetota bacterium]
ALQRDTAPAGDLVTTVYRQLRPEESPFHAPSTTTTHLPENAAVNARQSGPVTTTLGTFVIPTPGYYRIDLRLADGAALRNLRSLTLTGPAVVGAHANVVERRNAASVHLGYEVPRAQRDEVEWFYIELTPRADPLWTYYMATGWHRGYFGMQVNSPSERRLIFSVWDAGNEGIDRAKVAADDRVQLIAKGDGVVADSFGNEGTGGHSHLVHDWQVGDTFRFLMRAEPDGDHTAYTGWFWFAARRQWGLIASFRAPKDGKFLRGLYSFSENFSGQNGDVVRDCEFGNGWVRTRGGEWLPLTTARFTHDDTGKAARLDRHGGVRGERFFLQHGGFLEPPKGSAVRYGDLMTLPASATANGRHPTDGELPPTTARELRPTPTDRRDPAGRRD